MTILAVHLVRFQNGPRPLERFIDSYLAHRSGLDHDLLLALKGFETESEIRACLASVSARGANVQHTVVPDDGLDLTAYARVAAEVRSDRYCFLNSYSRVLADRWLAHLIGALDQPEVELAGATGSWTSHRDYRRYHLRLPSGYDEVFDDRERTRLGFLALARQRNPAKRNNGRLAFKAAAAFDLMRERDAFEGFPAPHLRTNAFVVSRELMLALSFPRIQRKRDAYRLESGARSFTHRVQEMGHSVVVVDRDGTVYSPSDWDRSLTLWQCTQPNLLVADNQTDDYQQANTACRRLLSQLAWGHKARPA